MTFSSTLVRYLVPVVLSLLMSVALHGCEGSETTTAAPHTATTTAPPSPGVKTKKFRSGPMPLSPGEVVFTIPKETILEFPKESSYAITKFHAEVVDDDWNSVPLSEVYNHHWLVFNTKGNQGVCKGYLKYIFGVGAESRNSPVEWPEGFGYHTHGGETWTANIHLLRTVGLKVKTNASQAVKECIECWYAPADGSYPGKGCQASQTGQFDCCQTGSQCPVDGSATGKKNYYLSYTIEYTTDTNTIKPVHVWLLDASGCKIEYNVGPEPDAAHPVRVTEMSWKSPVKANFVLGVGHVHSAAINVTLMVNGEDVCTSKPVYGTEVGKVGNEKGYLVSMPACLGKGQGPYKPFSVEAGDTFTVRSHYWVGYDDPTGSGLPGGFHGGVMSYFYIGAEVASVIDAAGRPVLDLAKVVWEPLQDVAV